MAKLKISAIADDKPVKMTIELPASVFRDLTYYAKALHRETQQHIEVAKLIAPMLERFMASDKGFRKMKRTEASLPPASTHEKQPDPSAKPQSAAPLSDSKPG
jgi:hypothetical protein